MWKGKNFPWKDEPKIEKMVSKVESMKLLAFKPVLNSHVPQKPGDVQNSST